LIASKTKIFIANLLQNELTGKYLFASFGQQNQNHAPIKTFLSIVSVYGFDPFPCLRARRLSAFWACSRNSSYFFHH